VLHNDNVKRIKQGLSNRNSQISALLTGEQQAQFDQMEKDCKSRGAEKTDGVGRAVGAAMVPARSVRPTTFQIEILAATQLMLVQNGPNKG